MTIMYNQLGFENYTSNKKHNFVYLSTTNEI